MRFSNCCNAEAIDSSLLFIKAEKHSRRACISSESDSALTSASHAAFPTTAANSSISKGSLGVNKGEKNKEMEIERKEKKELDNRTRGPHSKKLNQFCPTLDEEFDICYRPEATQGFKWP